MRERWMSGEIEFVLALARKGVHPLDMVKPLNEKFHVRRTYNGVRGVLWQHGIRHSLRRAILAKTGASPVPPLPLDKEEEMKPLSESEMRDQLSKLGYKIEKITTDKTDRTFRIDPAMFKGDTYKFGVLSCTHLGSMYQQLTYLRNFYALLDERNIPVALHTGDLVDGIKVYKGQEFELFLHGFDAQVGYAIDNYPRLKNGGKTYAIAGNHDYSFVKEVGGDPLEKIAKARPDIEYLGAFGAYPVIGPLRIYMQHGGSGNAYARSYRLQRNIEQFAPQAKPDIYFLGHYHSSDYLPMYRNVAAAMVSCFQSQTPFERRHGLYPEVAGMIVEVVINDVHRKNGLVGIKVEWIPFYVPKVKDY